MIGDSVHRQLFLSMFHYFRRLQYENNRFQESSPSASKNFNGWNVSIYKRFNDKSFTNFKDEDIIVKKDGKTMFSIRFVYASNAIDFPGRCKSIKTWFFQCLKSFEDILIKVSAEEAKRMSIFYGKKKAPRKSSNSMQGRYIDDELHGGDIDRPKISAHHDEVGSDNYLKHDLRKEMQTPSVAQTTILYINTGLWDWRTGLLPKKYYDNLKRALKSAAKILGIYDKIFWRTSSAAWPSKFMKEKECKSKGKADSRPCSVHTGEIYHMNELTIPLVQSLGFRIIPSWEVTSTRPDLSHDGLHYPDNACDKRWQNKTTRSGRKKNLGMPCSIFNNDQKIDDVNSVINNFFFNEVCLP
eukprot:g2447.t1